MNEPKICPLLSIGRTADPAPCQGDKCAWWHKTYEPLADLTISICAVEDIAVVLDDIKRYGIG